MIKKDIDVDIKKISENASVSEIQKMVLMSSAYILAKKSFIYLRSQVKYLVNDWMKRNKTIMKKRNKTREQY